MITRKMRNQLEKHDGVLRMNILGVGVSVLNLSRTIEIINSWINNGGQNKYICVTGVHGIVESYRDEEIRKIHNNAGLVTPDGMPLVWLGRLKGFHEISRVYGPDLLLSVCDNQSFSSHKHFFYGSSNSTLKLLIENLKTKYPKIQIAGFYSPPYRKLSEEENKQVIEIINTAEPDFLWIGLSTPKQEKWMAEHLDDIPGPVMIGVGAAFDFHAGVKKQAPDWMQDIGLEWFYRLISEPHRLWRRYLVNNPLFIMLIIGQLLGIRKYSIN
jgi:N-acetylglucosaminyldiphosphoundecaprenol N-acetyl-beta-D-mannosaminyltransferase